MGRFARSKSGALSERAVNQSPVSARPRFSTDPQMAPRNPQLKSQTFRQPANSTKPDKPPSRSSSRNRRARKRIRLIALAVLSLVALSAGWMLGKIVIGPSRINQSPPAVSAQSAVGDKRVANSAQVSGLEAGPADVHETESASQDRDAQQSVAVQQRDVQDNQGRRSHRAAYSSYSRRASGSAKPRGGPGIGVVAKPIKVVFRPLKKVNPFKLRIW